MSGEKTYLDVAFRYTPLLFGFITPIVVLILALNAKNDTAALIAFAWLCVSITINNMLQIMEYDLIRVFGKSPEEIEEAIKKNI